MTEPVLLERRDAVALLTLNRPDVLNALDRATLEAIAARCAALSRDATVRAVVLTGSGRAFAAGADIAAMRKMGPARPRRSAASATRRWLRSKRSRCRRSRP